MTALVSDGPCALWVPSGLARAAVCCWCLERGGKGSEGAVPGARGVRRQQQQRPRDSGAAAALRRPRVAAPGGAAGDCGVPPVLAKRELKPAELGLGFILQAAQEPSIPVLAVSRCLCEILHPTRV